MYRAGEVSVHLACCERAIQSTHLEGSVRFDQAQDHSIILDLKLKMPCKSKLKVIWECAVNRELLTWFAYHGVQRHT